MPPAFVLMTRIFTALCGAGFLYFALSTAGKGHFVMAFTFLTLGAILLACGLFGRKSKNASRLARGFALSTCGALAFYAVWAVPPVTESHGAVFAWLLPIAFSFLSGAWALCKPEQLAKVSPQ